MNSEAVVIPDDLVTASRAGDPAALSSLWDLCAPLLQSAIRRHRARLAPLDPADLAQEAALLFLKLVREDPPEDSSSAEPFQQRYARALYWRLHDYLRAERRRLGRQINADEPELERALRQRAAGSTSGPPGRRVARAIEQLSPRQRAVVAGIYFDDRKVATIAHDLGISPQAVTALHRRALAGLRRLLCEDEDADVQRGEDG